MQRSSTGRTTGNGPASTANGNGSNRRRQPPSSLQVPRNRTRPTAESQSIPSSDTVGSVTPTMSDMPSTAASNTSIQFSDDIRRNNYSANTKPSAMLSVPELPHPTDTEADTNDESETASLLAASSLASNHSRHYGANGGGGAYRYGHANRLASKYMPSNSGNSNSNSNANNALPYVDDEDDEDEEDFIYRGNPNPIDNRRQTWAQPAVFQSRPFSGIPDVHGSNVLYTEPNLYGNYSEVGMGGAGGGHPRRHWANPTTPIYLRSRTAAKRWLRRRSGAYDEVNHDLMRENNGIRVWYSDYTTIDWIHDFVKERVRLRKLRAIKGFRGHLINGMDGLQGWILMLLIGVICGCVAAGMDISSRWLFDLKFGFCTTNFRWNRQFCCWGSSDKEECADWEPWADTIPFFASDHKDAFINWSAYVLISVGFATLAALLVHYAGTLPTTKKLAASQTSRTNLHTPTDNESILTSYQLGGQHRPRIDSQSHYDPLGSDAIMDAHTSGSLPPNIKYFASGSGIPEVKTILSGFVIRGFLGIQTLWVKVVSLTLAVAAGLSIGRQGPLVHIACCVGNIACRLFKKYNKNEGKRREILSASAAAGVAVAFGAPIGGVLFSLEEVSYYFPSKTMWRSFFCALTAAFTLKVINPWQTGKMVLFQVTYDRDWHNYDLIGFAILGLGGGLYGGLFIRMFKAWMKSRPHELLAIHPVREVTLVALVTALLSWGNKFSRLDATGFVADLFSECKPEDNLGGLCARTDYEYYHIAKLLVIAMLTKMITTVIAVGAKIPAGVFIPHMIFGAAFGRVVGMTMQHFYRIYPGVPFFSACTAGDSCVMPGVYAMVGAAATATGVTRMTLSMSVIMFELTGSLTYMIPVMIAVMIAKWTADAVHRASFFEVMIERNGHPYLDNKKDFIRVGSTAEVMERGFEVIDVDDTNTVAELTDKLDRLVRNGYPDGGFPIVEADVLIGYIATPELHHALNKVKHKGEHVRCYFKRIGGGTGTNGQIHDKLNDFTAYMDRAPLSVAQSASMELVMELFAKLGLRYLCVVRHGRYVGMIHKKRLLAYLHQLEEEERL